MLRKIAVASAAFLLLLLSGCSASGGKTAYISDSFLSMDTVITVSISPDTPDADEVFRKCRELTERYRLIFDAADPASAVSVFNASAEGGTVPAELYGLYLSYSWVCEASGGAFDMTLRPLTSLWKTAEKNGVPPSRDAVLEALENCGRNGITAGENNVLSKLPGRQLDMGAIAKGAAAGAAVALLEDLGVEYGLVSFGGNVAVFGAKPDGKEYSIGIRDPLSPDPSRMIGTVSVDRGFISVSGDYERYFVSDGKKYHHIIDPASGFPAESGLCSTAVLCEDGALADALSTALFVMGRERAMEFYSSGVCEFEAVFVESDGRVSYTPGLEGRFSPR